MKTIWENGIKIGLIGGVSAVLLALIGMVEAFSQRDIISNVISMGHTLLLGVAMFMGYLAAKRTTRTGPVWILLNSLLSGLIVGGFVALLVIVGSLINLRKVFAHVLFLTFQPHFYRMGVISDLDLLKISVPVCQRYPVAQGDLHERR
jgi:hypothetical protein